MSDKSNTQNPPVGYHFRVSFFINGDDPDPVDMRFQKVSGITATVDTTPLVEGGENFFVHNLPKGITYDNLKLERGMVIDSRPSHLSSAFKDAMSRFEFNPSDVMVSLLDENSSPIANWRFVKAYPVKWSISDLDANSNAVVIESMELKYTRFLKVSI